MRGQDPKLGNTATAARGDGRPSRKPREGRKDAVVTRREFLDVAIATAFVAGVGHSAWAVETKGGIPYRILGRTGEKVSIVGLGGYHLGQQADEQESLRIIRTAIDNGGQLWGDHVRITRNHFIGYIGNTRGGRFGRADVYAGRDGRVYRRDSEGHWQEHTRGGNWAGLRGPATEHEQWHQARELGQQRSGNFNRGFSSHGFGGGSHGGGFGGGSHGGGGHGGGGHR